MKIIRIFFLVFYLKNKSFEQSKYLIFKFRRKLKCFENKIVPFKKFDIHHSEKISFLCKTSCMVCTNEEPNKKDIVCHKECYLKGGNDWQTGQERFLFDEK